MSSQSPYHDHILGARDVCANCLQLIRAERIDPHKSNEFETATYYTRRKRKTEIAYGPSETASEAKGVFCECGVEAHRLQDRIWSYTEPDRDRFETLLKNAVRTLRHKGVTVDRKTLVGHALQAWADGQNADGAIEYGLDAALATTASTDPAEA